MDFKKAHVLLFSVCFLTLTLACHDPGKKQGRVSVVEIDTVVRRMSDIMVHDVTNPPLAARFFAYAFLAGYEIVSQNSPSVKSMGGILNGYEGIEKPEIPKYNYQLAALLATIETASRLQPSGKRLIDLQERILYQAKEGFDDETISGSLRYATEITEQILTYANSDGYRTFSDYPRYSPMSGEGFWFPTPPAFIGAVEPHFNKLRPFFLDSCSQFVPPAPAAFDKDRSSAFFASMDSVYQVGNQLTREQREIAAFWDCNPFALEDLGHLKVGLKKISPGAHWMGIAGIAAVQGKLSFDSSMMVHSVLALALTDAFISCWDEKYRSNRIRPETAIRKYIDPEWKPFLQTPPFPEYPSGHSVVSGASSEVLSHFFGNSFAYKDSVEQDFGLPPRWFNSFKEAAQEAAVSRFYGGIHFMDANINGLKQGELVGKQALSIYLTK